MIIGRNIGLKVCDALGIDSKHVTGMTIEIPADGLVKVTIEKLVSKDANIDKFCSVFEQFNLVPKSASSEEQIAVVLYR